MKLYFFAFFFAFLVAFFTAAAFFFAGFFLLVGAADLLFFEAAFFFAAFFLLDLVLGLEKALAHPSAYFSLVPTRRIVIDSSCLLCSWGDLSF